MERLFNILHRFEKVKKENVKLKEALTFYARSGLYTEMENQSGVFTLAERDGGKIARIALEETK